jgi:hypothetical protein
MRGGGTEEVSAEVLQLSVVLVLFRRKEKRDGPVLLGSERALPGARDTFPNFRASDLHCLYRANTPPSGTRSARSTSNTLEP